MDDESFVIQQDSTGKTLYVRSHHNESMKLCSILNNCYNVNSIVTPSGMSAISTTIMGIMKIKPKQNYHIIYSSELYCDTPRLFKHFKEMHNNVSIFEFDIRDIIRYRDDVIDYLKTIKKTDIVILFFESCSNPNGHIFDMDVVKLYRKQHTGTFYTVVDNTWLTHVIYNPFLRGADIVVSSLTKYYSGGTAIGGAIFVNNKKIFSSVIRIISVLGLHVSPENCNRISNGIMTMEKRIITTSNIMKTVLEYKNKKCNFIHPMMPNHSSYKLANSYLNGFYPGVMMVECNNIPNFDKSSLEIKTSFGASHSRICPYSIHNETVGFWFRLAIGYDDNPDIILENLEKLFVD